MSARPRRTWLALATAFAGLAGLAAAFVRVSLAHRERERMRTQERALIEELAGDVKFVWESRATMAPLSRGMLGDPTGQRALRASVQPVSITDLGAAFYLLQGGEPVRDLWGHELIYRCPGPVHPHGWDLYSCGPDGIDDQGENDDVLFGEDVAPVPSGSH